MSPFTFLDIRLFMIADTTFPTASRPRMYKAQFARWGWSKYNCKRLRSDLSSGKAVVKSQGKSCYRVKRSRAANADKDKRPVKVSKQEDSSTQPAQTPTSPSRTTSTTPATSATTVVTRRPPIHHQQPGMVRHIVHANDTTRFMQSVLSDIRSHVCEVFSRKPDWHQSRRSKIALINAYNYTSYDKFVVAMDAFLKNEHTNGGEILRQAFLEVEDAIQTDYSSTFYFFFIDLPDLFLHYGRNDILTILLGHIKRLTGAVRLRDKISGKGFAALHALAETDPAYLRHYISTASGLWCDLLSELRGPRDRSTLLAKRNYLRHDRSVDHRRRVGELCDDYVVLMDEVHQQFGNGHDMSRHMEDVCLSAQSIHDFFVEGFVEQNERLVQSVNDKYRVSRPPPGAGTTTAEVAGGGENDDMTTTTTTTLPLEAWDVLDHNIRSNCYDRLSYFYNLQGDMEKSDHYSRKASEGWRGNYWHLEAEGCLVAAGRHFEAESLRRCRLEAQYFRKLPDNDKLLPGRSEFLIHRIPGRKAAVAG